jgi:hypothetical protein
MSAEIVRQLVAAFSYKLDEASEKAILASLRRVRQELGNNATGLRQATNAMSAFARATNHAAAANEKLARSMSSVHKEARQLNAAMTNTSGANSVEDRAMRLRIAAQGRRQMLATQRRVLAKEEARLAYDRDALDDRRARTALMAERLELSRGRTAQMAERLGLSRAQFRYRQQRDATRDQQNKGFSARRRLSALATGVGLASRGVGQIAGSTQIFRTGALGAMGVGAGLGMSWFQATAQLQDVQADLQIATGSAEKAQRAMDFVTKFAVGSRSTVLEVADAFAKLTSFGLDPTIDRMTALNNVATAANVSLSDLVEGAKNVSIGYTRVLERYIARFGYQIFIQRKNEGAFKEGDIMGQLGDQPRFRIGRTTADVISFLSTLGMSDRLKQAAELKVNTLAGALDKLRDSWLLMMYSVNKTGTAERMMAILTALSDMMTGQGGSAFSKSLGEGLNYVFDSVQRGIEFMIKNPDAVKQFLAETVNAFKTMVDMINTVGKFMAEHKDFLFFALQNLDKILTVAFIAPVLASVVSAVAGVANVILGLAALKGGVLGAGAAAGAAAAVGGGLSVGAIAAAALAALPVILAAIGLSGAIYGVYRGTKIDEDEDYVMKSGDVPITEGTFKGFHFRPDDPNMRATVRQGFEPIYAPPSMAPGVRSSQSNQQSINIRVGDVKVAAPEGTDPDEFGARVSTSLVDTMQTSLLRFIGEANVRGA